MKEYKTSKGYAILIYICAPLLIILFVFLLVKSIIDDKHAAGFMVPISLAMIGLMIAGLIETAKGKFVIDTDRVYTVGLFPKRELMLNEIKGYRISDKYIFIEPNAEGKKKIKISTYYAEVNEVIQWLSSNYRDLDVLRGIEEKNEILRNEEFGMSEEDRSLKLQNAKKIAKLVNIVGGAVAAWAIFYPKPYQYAIFASIIVPLIAIAGLKYFKGLIHIDQKKGSAHPSVFLSVIFTAIALGLRATFDFQIFDHTNAWLPISFITLVLSLVLVVGSKEFRFKEVKNVFSVIAISMLFFFYSYGAVITLNCFYDKSYSEVYGSKVISKRISKGKSTSYYLRLAPWGPQKEEKDISVNKGLYNRVNESQIVEIIFHKGEFNIPWFEIMD